MSGSTLNAVPFRSTIFYTAAGTPAALGTVFTVGANGIQSTTNALGLQSLLASTMTASTVSFSTMTASTILTQASTITLAQNVNVPNRFVEIGCDQANSMYMDFHSSDAALPDYSTRIISQGGATTGTGGLNMYASTIGLVATNGVGIGTTVPSAPLHLITAPTANGIINVSNSTTLSSTASSQDILQRWVENTNNTSVLDLSLMRVSAGSDWTTSAQRFQSKIDATWQAYMQFYNYGIQFGAGSSTTSANSIPVAMTIISGGNVGIGTTNPTAPLYVKYGTNADSTGGPSGTWASILYNATNVSGANGLLVKNNWRGAGSTIFECGSDFVGGAYASFFTINGVGSVGIGTTVPQALLHVNGGLKTAGLLYSFSASIASLATSTNTTTNLIPQNSIGVYLVTVTGLDTTFYRKLTGTAIVSTYYDGGSYYTANITQVSSFYVTFVSISNAGVITFNQSTGGTASISITALCIG